MDARSIRTVLVTGAIGAVTALGLSMFGLLGGVNAEETPAPRLINPNVDPLGDPMGTLMSPASRLFPKPFDASKLLRWNFEVDSSVSLDPIRQSTVRKVGYGKVETVNIVETTSGIYSSDAITDPHIKYPGIVVTPRDPAELLLQWNGFDWGEIVPASAGSFVTIVPFDGGQLVVSENGTCSYTVDGTRC